MLFSRLKFYHIGLFLILGTMACRKVITLDLHTTAKKLVVEGNITNIAGGCQVLLSQTANFTDDNTFPGVSGAVVSISDNEGNNTQLTETSAGVYEAPSLVAVTGVTYQLHVSVNGDTVSAVSTLPVEVPFDSLYVTVDNLFGNTWKLANVAFTDPVDHGHYYQFVQWINGTKTQQIYTAENDLTAGRAQDIKLYLPPNTDDKLRPKTGDVIQVEMQCLDSAVHEYWFSAQQSATGSNQNAVPSNPVSNLQGNALGYFSAHTSQMRTVTVF